MPNSIFTAYRSRRKSLTRYQHDHQLLIEQRLMGVGILLITAIILWMASRGAITEDSDCTAALVTLPLGLWMLCSKHIIIV